MSNEIQIETKEEWLTREEKIIIRKNFFPQSATGLDMQYCMSVAKSFNLNPILKQIYFIERKAQENGQWITKIEPLAGRDSFLTLAHRTGRFDGLESHTEIKEVPKFKNGIWENVNELVAIATVWVKGTTREFKVEVSYSEYVQRKRSGEVTKFWLEKPHTMLKKVAESQVLRKAFDITGLYDESELGNNHEKKETKIENNIKPNMDFAKIENDVTDTDVGEIQDGEIIIEGKDLDEMKESLNE